MIHGLDELVHFYRTGKRTGLQHPVGPHFCPGGPAPPEARLHGNENLLHRACSSGNLVVVRELLAAGGGYRYPLAHVVLRYTGYTMFQ